MLKLRMLLWVIVLPLLLVVVTLLSIVVVGAGCFFGILDFIWFGDTSDFRQGVGMARDLWKVVLSRPK